MRLLFISWDAPNVNYVDSLFLPAFARLKDHGVHVDILQFRWGDRAGRDRLAADCAARGIGYRSAEVWRKPSNLAGTLLTIARAPFAIRSAVRAFRSDILMPRGLFMVLATMLAGGPRLRPIIYDSDGLEADLRAEAGQISPTGLTYRAMRAIEAKAARTAEATLVRTDFNAETIRTRAGPSVGADRFQVMTCGRDPASFQPLPPAERAAVRSSLGFDPSAPLVVYVGSAWLQYRTSDIARFVAALRTRAPGAGLLFLTSQPDEARTRLAEGDPEVAADALVMSAPAADVPRLVAAADVGMSLFVVNTGSRAQSPIKLGEYLMCGVPVIGTAEVGDTAPAIAAGVFFPDSAGPDAAADWLVGTVIPNREAIAAKAREVGVDCFSLDNTVRQYLQVIAAVERRLAVA